MVDIINDPNYLSAGKHYELEKAEVKKDEDSVEMDVLRAQALGF